MADKVFILSWLTIYFANANVLSMAFDIWQLSHGAWCAFLIKELQIVTWLKWLNMCLNVVKHEMIYWKGENVDIVGCEFVWYYWSRPCEIAFWWLTATVGC